MLSHDTSEITFLDLVSVSNINKIDGSSWEVELSCLHYRI